MMMPSCQAVATDKDAAIDFAFDFPPASALARVENALLCFRLFKDVRLFDLELHSLVSTKAISAYRMRMTVNLTANFRLLADEFVLVIE